MMYCIDGMESIGLKKGQSFPSPAYRRVAQNLVLANPLVNNADKMVEVVQCVLAVPAERIEKITYEELRTEFGLPPLFCI